MALLQPPQFMLEDVQSDRIRQILNDPAGPAANVQDALRALNIAEDDPMSRSLPVPLQPNRAVEGPMIIIGRRDGVTQSPHPHQGFSEGPSELEESHMGAAGAPGHIMERNLEDSPSFRMHADQDLLQHVEVPRHQRESHQHVAMVHAEPAGEIAERKRQDPAVSAVQNMAQQPSEPAHVSPPAEDVAGGDQYFRLVAPPPELFQEHRSV